MASEAHGSNRPLTIDFDRPESNWSVLVIDDRWFFVKAFVEGATSSLVNVSMAPNQRYLNLSAVQDYWQNGLGRVGTDNYEQTLLELPWAFSQVGEVGRIVFAHFPDDKARLRELLEIAGERTPFRRRVACLIDVTDDTKVVEHEKLRFDATWAMLDSFDHPVLARAQFSRGGQRTRTEGIRKIPKDPDPDYLLDNLRRWFRKLSGRPDPDLYQRHTGGTAPHACHNPSDLEKAPIDSRRAVCDALIKDGDEFGVWHWSADLALTDPLPAREVSMPDSAASRWLCAKSFQTVDPAYTTPQPDAIGIPLTAVIAVCGGAPFVQPKLRPDYHVVSPLDKIENIDERFALGCIQLKSGAYGEFVTALRDWIGQPEQFEPGKSRLISTSVTIGTDRASILFHYTGDLPDTIFAAAQTMITGRARRAWSQLYRFAESTHHHGALVEMIFRHER